MKNVSLFELLKNDKSVSVVSNTTRNLDYDTVLSGINRILNSDIVETNSNVISFYDLKTILKAEVKKYNDARDAIKLRNWMNTHQPKVRFCGKALSVSKNKMELTVSINGDYVTLLRNIGSKDITFNSSGYEKYFKDCASLVKAAFDEYEKYLVMFNVDVSSYRGEEPTILKYDYLAFKLWIYLRHSKLETKVGSFYKDFDSSFYDKENLSTIVDMNKEKFYKRIPVEINKLPSRLQRTVLGYINMFKQSSETISLGEFRRILMSEYKEFYEVMDDSELSKKIVFDCNPIMGTFQLMIKDYNFLKFLLNYDGTNISFKAIDPGINTKGTVSKDVITGEYTYPDADSKVGKVLMKHIDEIVDKFDQIENYCSYYGSGSDDMYYDNYRALTIKSDGIKYKIWCNGEVFVDAVKDNGSLDYLDDIIINLDNMTNGVHKKMIWKHREMHGLKRVKK